MDARGQEHGFPTLHGFAVGLKANHPPGQFDEDGPEATTAMLGDGEIGMLFATGTDATTQTSKGTRGFAVGESVPVEDLAFDLLKGESAHAGGQFGRGIATDDMPAEGLGCLESFFDHGTIAVEVLDERGGKEFGGIGPGFAAPPGALKAEALGQSEGASHGGERTDGLAELGALTDGGSSELGVDGGDTNHGQSGGFAGDVAAEATCQFPGVGAVVVDATVVDIETTGDSDDAGDAEFNDTAMKPKTGGTRLVAAPNLVGQRELVFGKLDKGVRGEGLGGLERQIADLTNHLELAGVDVGGELDARYLRDLQRRGSRLEGASRQVG